MYVLGGPLIGFVILFVSAKLMESRRWPFYKAALLASGLFSLASISDGLQQHDITPFVVKLLLALPVFFFLEKYQDTIAAWLVTFVIGFYLLVLL